MTHKQLDLFIQTNIACKCNVFKHVFTKSEYQYSIDLIIKNGVKPHLEMLFQNVKEHKQNIEKY